MPSAARVGDTTTGHQTYPPQTIIVGSANVTINGSPAARVGDNVTPHTNTVAPFDTHTAIINTGSSTVTINGSPAARVGDALSCNLMDIIIVGSPTVTIG